MRDLRFWNGLILGVAAWIGVAGGVARAHASRPVRMRPSAHAGLHHTAPGHTEHPSSAARGRGAASRATRRERVAVSGEHVATRRVRGRGGRLVEAETPVRLVRGRLVRGRLVRGRQGRLVRVPVHSQIRQAEPHYTERFSASSFSDQQTLGDITAGEDPVVRAAAIAALGNMNGTAMAIDPATGRILAMVNQKLALSPGAEPCSTIKLSVALAALQEGLVTRETPVNLGGSYRMTLTQALAHSNNLYFETLGRNLGFERVKHYANQLGLGELAGYNIQGEQLGVYPDHELPAQLGGVGRMCSFGESVSMTPMQLGAIVSAIANGGTLYYLQHPTTPEQVSAFEPRIKRVLDIGKILPEMQDGMMGATYYGTARRLRMNFTEFPVLGKTGTCSNNGTRYGWFGSYADTPRGRIVTVIFLEGGRPVFGPKAAELTGQFYRALYDARYFQPKATGSPVGAVTAAGAQ